MRYVPRERMLKHWSPEAGNNGDVLLPDDSFNHLASSCRKPLNTIWYRNGK